MSPSDTAAGVAHAPPLQPPMHHHRGSNCVWYQVPPAPAAALAAASGLGGDASEGAYMRGRGGAHGAELAVRARALAQQQEGLVRAQRVLLELREVEAALRMKMQQRQYQQQQQFQLHADQRKGYH
jgi:hypothetical protein